MRVLAVTNMWPTEEAPQFGVFVKRQVEELGRLGVDIDVVFVNGRASRLNYARGFPETRERLHRHRYDLVHAFYVFSGVIARAQRRCPVVLTHTGIEVLEGWQAPLSWVVSRLVDGVVVRSEEMKRRLRLPDAAVIPSGVDLELFHPLPREDARRALGLATEARIVLFVGEQRPEKRLDVIEGAVARLRRENGCVELVKVSGKPQNEIVRYLNAADVLVLASEREGSPGVVKEALACDVPVVSSAVGDVPELIRRSEGSYLAERTPEDFAEKLRRVLADGGRASGRAAVAHLGWPEVTRSLLEVYERVARPAR
jgi:teichuronic acid biosynthesis glycosyltransferase TuaC